MSKDHIYKLLSHFYGLLVNDFPKTGLVTKGIYEVEQVFKTIENLPDDQEHLIRYEIRQFLTTLEQVQEGYRINFSNEETRILENLREVVCPI